MNKNVFYLAGLLLMLLSEMIPIIPKSVVVVSVIFFLLYLMNSRLRISVPYLKWMLCVFGFFTLSVLWALDILLVRWVLVFQLIPIFIGTIATYSYLKSSPSGIRSILWVYLLAALVLTVSILMNIDQLESGKRLSTVLNEEDEKTFNSNNIGMCLCYTLYVGYLLLFRGKKYLYKILTLIAGLVLIWLILLTGSRKAILMLVIPVLFFSFQVRHKSWLTFVLPLSLSILVIFYNFIMDLPIFYDVMGRRVEDMMNILTGQTQGSEDISRVILIEYGLEWFKDNPVLGYGINNFRVLSNQTSLFLGHNFYAHNNYVELLVDVGIVGFFIYYSCYYFFWKHLKGTIRGNRMNTWIMALIVVRLFLDTAQVSYYSFISNLIICMCFYAVDNTRQTKLLRKVKYETSRHNTPL